MSIFKQIIFLGAFMSCSLAFATPTNETVIQKTTHDLASSLTKKNSLEKERIRALQIKLSDEGYYSGAINGEKTLETRRAIKNWAMDRD